MRLMLVLSMCLGMGASAFGQEYDFLLKGGHVIDAKNKISAVRDVAIKDGKIAEISRSIPASRAVKAVDASGLYVTPGLIDIHVHMYPGETINSFARGNWSLPPDGFTLPNCVTTVADAGGPGWRNFEDFKTRIVEQSRTRVTTFLNIVGSGMAGAAEQNLADMEVKPTADMALKHKGVIVGIKSAHYSGPEWTPYERAVEVGRLADIPVMIDFGSTRVRSIAELFAKYLRPGDIYTHTYGGNRGEQDRETKGPSKAVLDARARGILFDVGHGAASFRWTTAVPLMKAGFVPDSISTDLHVRSMTAALKDMVNLMGKFLAMGMPLDEVVRRSTWNPAQQIKLQELGNLSIGSPADIAVLRVEKGTFGFVDPPGGRMAAPQRLACEMTLRDGKVVFDLNGMTKDRWDTLPADARGGDPRWDATTPRPPSTRQPRQ